MLELTINDRALEVTAGTNLLQAICQAGEQLPTLCHWEGLPPYGACRLCLVEVSGPEAGNSNSEPEVVAACTYPVAKGLVVDTNGPQAMAARRMILEFMLARCPNSATIQKLAAEAGVRQTRFAANGNEEELCILCGLCVRICRDLVGAAAISFIDRGADRVVGAPFWLQSETCIGCAACAAVCPTGAVSVEDVGDQRVLRTWNTTVPLHNCPECGRPYAPEPMSFLTERVPVSAELWGLCPKCRRQATVAHLEVVHI